MTLCSQEKPQPWGKLPPGHQKCFLLQAADTLLHLRPCNHPKCSYVTTKIHRKGRKDKGNVDGPVALSLLCLRTPRSTGLEELKHCIDLRLDKACGKGPKSMVSSSVPLLDLYRENTAGGEQIGGLPKYLDKEENRAAVTADVGGPDFILFGLGAIAIGAR